MRNANPRPADEAEETGLGASVFRFSKHETPGEMRRAVSRNETPAKSCFVSVVSLPTCFNSGPNLPHHSKYDTQMTQILLEEYTSLFDASCRAAHGATVYRTCSNSLIQPHILLAHFLRQAPKGQN